MNPIGSVTSRHYENAMNSVFGSQERRLSVSADGIWLRDDHTTGKFIIHDDVLDVEASNIINPIVYAFDAENNLTIGITADAMQLTDQGWVAEGVQTWDASGVMTEKGSLMLPSNLAALDLGLSSEPPNTIAVFSLPAFIELLERAGLPTVEHKFAHKAPVHASSHGRACHDQRTLDTYKSGKGTTREALPRTCDCSHHHVIYSFHAGA